MPALIISRSIGLSSGVRSQVVPLGTTIVRTRRSSCSPCRTRHHHCQRAQKHGLRLSAANMASSASNYSSVACPAPQVECESQNQAHDLHQRQLYVESLISSLPLTRKLRSASEANAGDESPTYEEMPLHDNMHPAALSTHLVSGSLLGKDKLPIQPYLFVQSRPSSRVISICYIGSNLCGHAGYIHGGLPFVLFDDIFARCAGAKFDSGVAMTANMNIDFRKPCLPDRVYTVRAELTKTEGRKAWLSGSIRCLSPFTAEEKVARSAEFGGELSPEEENADLVAEASALFIEPKFASV